MKVEPNYFLYDKHDPQTVQGYAQLEEYLAELEADLIEGGYTKKAYEKADRDAVAYLKMRLGK